MAVIPTDAAISGATFIVLIVLPVQVSVPGYVVAAVIKSGVAARLPRNVIFLSVLFVTITFLFCTRQWYFN